MAKINAVLGFTYTQESLTKPSVWEKVTVEKTRKATVIRNYKRVESSDKINDDFNISNRISIVSNPFINNNLSKLTYVEFLGNKWKITGIEINYPRLLLTIGGLYNGE